MPLPSPDTTPPVTNTYFFISVPPFLCTFLFSTASSFAAAAALPQTAFPQNKKRPEIKNEGRLPDGSEGDTNVLRRFLKKLISVHEL
jgi:hypothetical protein